MKKRNTPKPAPGRSPAGQKPKYIFNPEGGPKKKRTRLDLSETDEDEDEGVGDGRMGDASDVDHHLRGI